MKQVRRGAQHDLAQHLLDPNDELACVTQAMSPCSGASPMPERSTGRARGLILVAILVLGGGASGGLRFGGAAAGDASGHVLRRRKPAASAPPVSVSLVAERRDMPVVLEATGTVSALTSVDVKPQMASVVTQVHVKEGQFVRRGDLLFTLDAQRQANLGKAQAQLAEGSGRAGRREAPVCAQPGALRAELHLAGRGRHQPGAGRIAAGGGGRRSRRHRRGARGPVLRAHRGAQRRARGQIPVVPGSYVQPGGAALVTITQLDPISVAFSLPQRNLPDALAAGRPGAPVQHRGAARGRGTLAGRLQFVDNAVDAATGTVRVKAGSTTATSACGRGLRRRAHGRAHAQDAVVVPQAAIVHRRAARWCSSWKGGRSGSLRPVQVLHAAGNGRRAGSRGRRAHRARGPPERAAGQPGGGAQRAGSIGGLVTRAAGIGAMNLSELFIRRPVMTVLLNLAIVLAGVIAYTKHSGGGAASYNTPVINVCGAAARREPGDHGHLGGAAAGEAVPTIGAEHHQLDQHAGSTSLTLEFDEGRNIDAAAVDVQAALLRAQRSLPQDMTNPPSYRKVNPADAPVLLIALTSPSLALHRAERLCRAPDLAQLSTLDGVALVNIFGQKRYAVRARAARRALAARNISLDELTAAALRAANANTPVGTLDGARQTLTLQANRQLRNAQEFAELIVATRNAAGAPVRLRDVARVEDSVETVKTYANFNGEPSITLAIQRQPDANTVKVVDAVRAALPGFKAQLPQSVQMNLGQRPLGVDPRGAARRDADDARHHRAGGAGDLPVPAPLRRDRDPRRSLPVSLVGAISLLWGLGYSLDNISLLGLTLAVGLVVDDAIVMLENIIRHVEEGMPPFQAALRARARWASPSSRSPLADRGVHPDLLHARRDRPAVPRVRGDRRRWRSSPRPSSR